MQRRSSSLFLEGRDLKRAGKLGNIRMVRTFWLNNDLQPTQTAIRRTDRLAAVARTGLSCTEGSTAIFRLAQLLRVLERRRHGPGRPYLRFDSHDYGLQALRFPSTPPLVVDISQMWICRNPWVVVAEYAEDFMAVFTINYSAMRYPMPEDQLNCYDGDISRMDLGRDFLRVYEKTSTSKPAIDKTGMDTGQAVTEHIRNFLECVRTRSTPRATVEVGFQAALVLLLANLSVKQGKRMRWNASEHRVEA